MHGLQTHQYGDMYMKKCLCLGAALRSVGKVWRWVCSSSICIDPTGTVTVHSRYSHGTIAVFSRYTHGMLAGRPRYSHGTLTVCSRYASGTPAVRSRYASGTPPVCWPPQRAVTHTPSISTSPNNIYYVLLIGNCSKKMGHPVAQLVEALRYKLEGRGFDSRWCHWNFSLT